MEEKQNCIQTLVNKGKAQFCYKKQKMESYVPFTACRRRQIQQKKSQIFKIVTDCSACQKTMQKKNLITRIARWTLQLEELNYEIEHRAGSRMKHVDALSRYPVMIVCNDTLTSKLKKEQEEDDNIQTLKSLLETGSAFTSKLFNDYCDEENIHHLQIATGVPRGNGQVERIHRTLIPVLTKLSLDDSTKWYKYVDRLQRILNSTICRNTKWTPIRTISGNQIA
ncbi:retrovirus-related Pol polyprotein from transposon 17.6 [Trichonephila clavipes]|nr:retrovirus-related Pol polyprotein from transposon 17.6 [Trichonephila clavipes]